ncbi:MAG: type II toxin-antitoxin system RelB/DinJ family antitoxin [Oscillospiraceae bacterium]|jgi:DNA-damage-inducible protein J|nr:type II toxin-antitoxin system RelB/DinJ family antitoxin [Oscillospiraceae bacterium]
MAKTESFHMRVAPEIKSEADAILSRLGMTTADAVNIFFTQIIMRGGLPFEVKIPVPNEATRRAMEDAESGVNLHRFGTADEMFEALGIG